MLDFFFFLNRHLEFGCGKQKGGGSRKEPPSYGTPTVERVLEERAECKTGITA